MNWVCKVCDYTTDEFNKVWDHCIGVLHIMCVIKKEIRND